MFCKGSRGWESLTMGGRRLWWQSEAVRVVELQGSCWSSNHAAALGHCHFQSVGRGDDGIPPGRDEAVHLGGPLWKGGRDCAAVASNPPKHLHLQLSGCVVFGEGMELPE